MLLPLGPTMTLAALVQTALSLLPTIPGTTPGAPGPTGRAPAGTSAQETRPTFVAPLRGGLVVLDRCRPPDRPWLPGHRGVDLGAAPGDVVLAAGAGLVLWAGDLAGRGVVSVLLDDGRRTTYEPVTAEVSIGEAVGAGQPLGRLATGASHCGGFPSCLHWGLVLGRDEYADPLSLLGRSGRPRLLPLGAGPVP
jgi:murein DD-endopeptidase MepM/ murein hydrolase activator NlpD